MSWNDENNRNLFLKLESILRFSHVVPTTPKISPEKLKLTVVEMRQVPVFEKIDSKDEKSSLSIEIIYYSFQAMLCTG